MGRLLVVGSVAFDTVRTPFGEATEVLGGSATYFSTAARFFYRRRFDRGRGGRFPGGIRRLFEESRDRRVRARTS